MEKLACTPNAITCFAGRIIGAILLAALFMVPSNPAYACGCCSEVGQRDEITSKIGNSDLEVLQALQFGSIAELFGIADDATGLLDLSVEGEEELFDFAMTSKVSPDLITFRLSHAGKGRGTISFPIPEQISVFRVDIRDGKISKGRHGPALYKEWRLNGDATLTGLVTKGIHKAKSKLVLQGRGISCPDTDDFSHWSLTVDGSRAQFRLTGELIK